MPTKHYLCPITTLPSSGARGFELQSQSVFVVTQPDTLRVFVNRCPHLGTPLEFMPDQFLSHDGAWIQCSTHGALFDKTQGLCVHGPCSGQTLTVCEHLIEEDALYVYI